MWQMIIPAALQLLEKVIPDPQAKAAAQIELMRLAQSGELAHLDASKEIALAQAGTNTVEAAQGTFRGGWRPAIGWTCAGAFCVQYLARPLLPWCAAVMGFDVPEIPTLDTQEIMGLVFGMLGLGTLRTYEKTKGTA